MYPVVFSTESHHNRLQPSQDWSDQNFTKLFKPNLHKTGQTEPSENRSDLTLTKLVKTKPHKTGQTKPSQNWSNQTLTELVKPKPHRTGQTKRVNFIKCGNGNHVWPVWDPLNIAVYYVSSTGHIIWATTITKKNPVFTTPSTNQITKFPPGSETNSNVQNLRLWIPFIHKISAILASPSAVDHWHM